ncbi:prepilin peptidase [Pseudonocardia spinosispora]|uniref:prepilin peptidase n=1 Tax=Pseudonocardia spinosispora TaxID=103441 RepID=UPI00056C4D28|nr:A24 family peptidase [Pseudonocardia spinosispora]
MDYFLGFGSLGVIAGWLARWLLGRTRRRTVIRPPWCELAVGLGWAACGGLWSDGRLPGYWLPLLLGLSWLGAIAGLTDLLHRRLPDVLTLPALPVAVLMAAPLGQASMWRAVWGALALFGVHLAVRVSAPAALGAGDVKLAAPLGAVLGAVSWPALLVGAVLASVLTAVLGIGGRLVRSRYRHTEPRAPTGLPHGSSMLASAWLVTFASVLVP